MLNFKLIKTFCSDFIVIFKAVNVDVDVEGSLLGDGIGKIKNRAIKSDKKMSKK